MPSSTPREGSAPLTASLPNAAIPHFHTQNPTRHVISPCSHFKTLSHCLPVSSAIISFASCTLLQHRRSRLSPPHKFPDIPPIDRLGCPGGGSDAFPRQKRVYPSGSNQKVFSAQVRYNGHNGLLKPKSHSIQNEPPLFWLSVTGLVLVPPPRAPGPSLLRTMTRPPWTRQPFSTRHPAPLINRHLRAAPRQVCLSLVLAIFVAIPDDLPRSRPLRPYPIRAFCASAQDHADSK